MAFKFNKINVIRVFKKGAYNASTAEIVIAENFKYSRHIDHFPLNLLRQEIGVFLSSVSVAESKRGEFASEEHGVCGNVHVPPSKVSDHSVNMRSTQVNHDEHHNIFMLLISGKILHH